MNHQELDPASFDAIRREFARILYEAAEAMNEARNMSDVGAAMLRLQSGGARLLIMLNDLHLRGG